MHPPDLAVAGPAPKRVRNRIRVAGNADRLAVIAAHDIRRGEVILRVEGRPVERPCRYSIQIGRDAHLAPPPDLKPRASVARYGWRYLNHSCEPNAYLRGLELVALADIPARSEITFDYNTTEWELASPFTCLCGAPSCVGTVRGYRWLDEAARVRLLPTLSEHLKSRT
jgi:hypothetical protein